jgi:EmrB/QacA subfamily drug resistance transporter
MATVTDAPASTPALTHKQIQVILLGLMAGMLLAALDQTIVSTSIRVIADDLHGLSAQAWVTTAYLITSTVTTPLYGKLSDIYGRRPMFITAISIFVVGSLMCTFATSMYELAAFRAFQGIGAGGLFSMALAILADIAPPRERAKYQGYFLAVFGMSSVIGPLVGGFFAGAETILGIAGWRWVFLINVPIGILALVVVSITLHIPHLRHDHRIDWWGAAALIIGLVPLLIVAEQGREWGWTSPGVLGLIALGVVGIVAFIFIEIRMKDEALIPMRLFSTSRVFSTGMVANVMIGLGMFGALSTLPLYLQLVKGATPTESGLLLIPMMIGIMGGSVVSGQLTMRTGRYKIFPVIGTALLTLSFFLMLTVDVDTGYGMLSLFFVMIGLGLGLCMQTLLIAVQNTVPAKDMGVATSSATFFRQMGGTLGVAVFLSLLFNSLPDKISSAFQSAAGNPTFVSAIQTAAQDPNSPSHGVAMALAQAQSNPAAAASISDSLNSDSSFLGTLDPAIARPFQEGYVGSTQLVYIIGGIIMAIAFVLVLSMKELPLRTKSALEERLAEQAAEGDADPVAEAEALALDAALGGEVDSGDATPSAQVDREIVTEEQSSGRRRNGGRHSVDSGDLVPAAEIISRATAGAGSGRHER